MGSVFTRRFTTDPGADVLLEIESVSILDLEPPAAIAGIGIGTVILMAEMEDGDYETPTEVTSPEDLQTTFGSLGYEVGGVRGYYASALTRNADAAGAETWNGNGFVQLSGKKFKRLIICRVNTSVGEVSLTPIPFVVGTEAAVAYNLEPGQIVAFDIGAGAVSTTFTGVAAVVTGVAGTFPTLFTGGETLTLGYDGAANFVVTFLAADQTNAQIVTRINQYAGFTFADLSGGQLRFTSRQRGSGARVRIVGGSTGVLATLGLTAATTSGTGNCANIDAATVAEIAAAVLAVQPTVIIEQQPDSLLRASTTSGASITVGGATTAAALGFAAGATGAAAPTADVAIPAGTVVTNAGATQSFVTTQTVTVPSGSTAAVLAKVRHATDDGTGVSALAGTVVKVATPPPTGAFKVNNLAQIGACMTEAQLDAAYVTALASTIDLNSVVKEANIIWSARQSNSIRRALKANVIAASAGGLFGRMAVIRPPMNTLKSVAESTSAEPGVGGYRHERVIYTYPNAATQVPLIAKRGTSGGTGFTSDGVVDVGADGFMASILSQLNPEEDPGQVTDFAVAVSGLESGANARGFSMTDYINFKAKGIAAMRLDDGDVVFQSGVTSVDPGTYENLAPIARRRMADYIEDTLARAAKKYGKKTNTLARRISIASDIRMWLKGLKSDGQEATQRIADFSVDEKRGNTPELLKRGLYRIIIKVQTLSSLRAIVLACTIGETVTIERLAA
jgi:hypothetical protein